MSRGNSILALASARLALTLAVHANGHVPVPQAASAKSQVSESSSEYLGSASCERCHEAAHTQWKNSLHIQMTRPVAEAKIAGDFRDGTKFAAHDRAYTFGTRDGKPYVSVSFGGRAPETFTVDYTLGANR